MSIRSSIVVTAAFMLLLAGCAPRQAFHRESPCTNSLYLRLTAEPPDSLSEREWIRLQDLERACTSQQVTAGNGMMTAADTNWWHGMVGMVLAAAVMGLVMWH